MLNEDLPAKRRRKKETAARWGVRTATAVIGTQLPWVAATLDAVGIDVLNRLLSEKEASRIERTLKAAVQLIEESLKLGREPRSDGFDGANPGDRSFPEEVVEGVLLRVQRENQERKLPHYSEFLHSYVFNSALDPASAGTIVSIADELSYRQFCILALTNRQTLQSTLHYDTRLRIRSEKQHPTDLPSMWEETFTQEVFDLESRQLTQISRGLLDTPHMVTLLPLGKMVCEVLGLSGIDPEILDDLKKRADPYKTRVEWLLSFQRDRVGCFPLEAG